MLDVVDAEHDQIQKKCMKLLIAWLNTSPNTGNKPRCWRTVLTAVKEEVGAVPAEQIKAKISSLTNTC